jgi:putative FmdB family regulatory protein
MEAANYDGRRMPIFEFKCETCGTRFEELTKVGETVPCPQCGAERARRLYSEMAPPSRQPRGARVRSDESQRREREATRQQRISDSRRRRAQGEKP